MKWFLSFTLLFTTSSAWAGVYYEPFDYSTSLTNLIGRTTVDGLSWSQAGPTPITNQPTINAGNLSYPGLAAGIGNSVNFGGNGTSARLNLPVGMTSGTVYYSFIFQLTNIAGLSTGGIFWAGFNNSVGTSGSNPTVVDTRLDVKAAAGGTYQIGLDKSSGSTPLIVFAPNTYTTNDVIFVVGSYTFNPGGVDESRLWINPPSSSFGASTPPDGFLSNTNGANIPVISSFVLCDRSTAEPRGIIADELLISTNWADVTPPAGPPPFTIQPHNQRAVLGAQAYFDGAAPRATSFQWQHNGINVNGATNSILLISNAQSSDAGTYTLLAVNVAGTNTSSAVTLNIVQPTYPVLTPLWSIASGSRPYMTSDSSAAPNQDCIAYNALSNQVIVVNRAGGLSVNVVDGTTGADLYQLNTNGISGGNAVLMEIAASDDGAIYAGNMTVNAANPNNNNLQYRLYRWANTDSNTLATLLWSAGDPAGQTAAFRWGDTLAVRGTGADTQVAVDEFTGAFAAIFTTTDPAVQSVNQLPYFQIYGQSTQGRSLQFGTDNSIWQKSRNAPLVQSSFDLSGFQMVQVTNLDVFSSLIGPVQMDFTRNFAAALCFNNLANTADSLDLYDITDMSHPILLGRAPFPVVHRGNDNSFGNAVFTTDRIFAIDGNNGIIAATIGAPPGPPLNIVVTSGNATLSWSTNTPGFTLQKTTGLTSPISWSSLGSGSVVGSNYSVTVGAAASPAFFRLVK